MRFLGKHSCGIRLEEPEGNSPGRECLVAHIGAQEVAEPILSAVQLSNHAECVGIAVREPSLRIPVLCWVVGDDTERWRRRLGQL